MNNKNIIVVLLALVILIVGGYLITTNTNDMDDEHHEDEKVASHEIYPGDVVKKIEQGEDIILLDVRTPEEYEEVHIENSLLLPVQQLSGQSLAAIGLGEDAKDKEIILYCRSGNRSKTAYDIMSSLGYTNIKSVSGGMIHWEEDEYPFTEVGPYEGPVYTGEAAEAVSSGGARISLDRTLHDFGVIPQFGGVVKADFTITNTGTEELVIGQLTTSCSCTSVEISRQRIPAGEEAIVTAMFDPDFHEEPLDVFKRTVFIPTNDPTNPEAEVAIQVDIAEGE